MPQHTRSAEIYLGTQGWSYRDWVGPVYPAGTSQSEYLRAYAELFNAVELDTTFYGTPVPQTVARWRDATPAGFVFTAKVPRLITHDRRLVDAQDDFNEFVDAMSALGPKLGAILIQLPPDFTADERPALERFLEGLPPEVRFAAEFRHRSWLTPETYELLRQHEVAWTIIDLHFMPIHVELTARFTYFRWLGDRKQIQRVHETQIDRKPRLDEWAERIDEVAQQLLTVYGFVNNHYSGHSPADVRYLRRKLGMPEPEEPTRLEQRTLL